MMDATGSEAVLAVYLTFPDLPTAERIATALVERRLVACVNLLPPALSVYRWEGRVVSESEVVAWAKTTRGRLPALVSAAQELHPYELPCVVAYPAAGGLDAYLGWVAQETEPATEPTTEPATEPETEADG